MIIKLCITIVCLVSISCTSNDNVPDIEKFVILGTEKFSSEKWKTSNQEQRALMVHDLLKNNNLLGKTRQDIIALLGKPTSYFDYDEFPAYVVGPKSITSEYAKGYVLAFITEKSTGLVKNYEIVPKL